MDSLQRFAIPIRAVAEIRKTRLSVRRTRATRGDPFHSPVSTPESVAVIIIKI